MLQAGRIYKTSELIYIFLADKGFARGPREAQKESIGKYFVGNIRKDFSGDFEGEH